MFSVAAPLQRDRLVSGYWGKCRTGQDTISNFFFAPGGRMKVAIVGGGICGLSLALNLNRRGLACCVYERVKEIKPLGVGITLLPHAMRELSALSLGDELLAAGI